MPLTLSRRDTLMALGASVLATRVSQLRAAETASPVIADAAATAGITFGTSIAQDMVDDPALAALYARQARVFTADWATKLDVMRPAPDVFDTRFADALLRIAAASGTPLRGHALAWNDSRPAWFDGLDRRELARVLDRHVEETVSAFRGRLSAWDVNEPFWPGHGLPGGWRDGPWYQAFGEDWPLRVLRRVAALDPTAMLILNEAHTEQWTSTGADIRSGFLRLIDRLLDAGVPLRAVGLQGHLQPQWAYDDAGFAAFVQGIGERGVEVHITELDVNDESFPDDVSERDALVADRYERFLGEVLQVPAVTTVITWQLSDRASHFMSEATPERTPRPLPFDADLRQKPALSAIISAFDRAASRRR